MSVSRYVRWKSPVKRVRTTFGGSGSQPDGVGPGGRRPRIFPDFLHQIRGDGVVVNILDRRIKLAVTSQPSFVVAVLPHFARSPLGSVVPPGEPALDQLHNTS